MSAGFPPAYVLAMVRREYKNMGELAAAWQPRADAGEPGAAEIVAQARALQSRFGRAVEELDGLIESTPHH